MLDKMERKRIPKPEHLDLLRRPLAQHKNNNGDDDDDEEMGLVRTRTNFFGDSSRNNNNRKSHYSDDDHDEIAIEGASVHNHEAGKLDAMERMALLLRTERIREWKDHQKFLRAQAQLAYEKQKREEARRAEEDRLMKEFMEKEFEAHRKEAENKFVVDLL